MRSPDFARNMRFVGHSDVAGRGDGMQIMLHRGHAYLGHPFSGGFSIVDLRDPRHPGEVRFIPAPPNTWNLHLQTHDDLLLVVNAFDLVNGVRAFGDERAYYTQSVGQYVTGAQDWAAGMSVYDISRPMQPRKIGQLDIAGAGFHRIWYVGGRYAYASALFAGYSDYILAVIDMADPTRPEIIGRWGLPGMAPGEGGPPSPPGQRWALHHAVISGTTAYACWRDGGLTLLDISDPTQPRLIRHLNWSPPFGGGTHSALPLPARDLLVVADEAVLDGEADGRKHIWVFDIRSPQNPVSIATFPIPAEADYIAKGGHFGPHNLHENRPGSFVADRLIFATWQNAGVRAVDISDPCHPVERGAYVPAAPDRVIDPRPNRPRVIQTADVFADANGLLYLSDYGAGIEIVEFTG